MIELGADGGILPWLSVVADAFGAASRPEMGLVAGLRVAPIATPGGAHLVVSAGYLRELSGGSGLRPLRLGVEYVAQDLEGAVDPEEAEREVRHFVGPTASLELLARRLSVTAGPAIGLSRESPALLGRVGVAYAY